MNKVLLGLLVVAVLAGGGYFLFTGSSDNLKMVGSAISNDNKPLELTKFEGAQIQTGLSLKWAIPSNAHYLSFDVERSKDGNTFERIGTVKAITQSETFDYTDASPLKGVNYYRLKKSNFDGSASYSKVLSFNLKDQSLLTVTPTEAKDFITVNIPSPAKGEQVTLIVRNDQNKVMQSGNYDAESEMKMDVSKLPAGKYILEAEGTSVTQKVNFTKK